MGVILRPRRGGGNEPDTQAEPDGDDDVADLGHDDRPFSLSAGPNEGLCFLTTVSTDVSAVKRAGTPARVSRFEVLHAADHG